MIEELIRRLDNPLSTIAYPTKPINHSDTGHVVYGLDPSINAAMADREIVGPVQVVRRPGLGDKIFGLAAAYAFCQQNPDMDVTFAGLDTDTWLKQIPWVKTGINPDCNTVVNLDNTPCNGGDRVELMAGILGVRGPVSIEFPITVPRKKLGLKKPYFVFAPWAARKGPRSLPTATVISLLKNSPIPLALTDSVRAEYEVGDGNTNCTGLGMLDLLVLLSESAGVVGCDTGVVWLGQAMSRPALCFFSHVAACDRSMTTRNLMAVKSPASCAANCGDHCGTMPECRFKDRVPLCTSFYTPEFMRFQMREFERLTV